MYFIRLFNFLLKSTTCHYSIRYPTYQKYEREKKKKKTEEKKKKKNSIVESQFSNRERDRYSFIFIPTMQWKKRVKLLHNGYTFCNH